VWSRDRQWKRAEEGEREWEGEIESIQSKCVSRFVHGCLRGLRAAYDRQRVCVCARARSHSLSHTHAHAHTQTHAHTHTHIYTHTHTRTHTHTHTHKHTCHVIHPLIHIYMSIKLEYVHNEINCTYTPNLWMYRTKRMCKSAYVHTRVLHSKMIVRTRTFVHIDIVYAWSKEEFWSFI